MLNIIDNTVTALAVVCVLFLATHWLRSGRRDPLRDAPPRPNHLREDSVALAVAGYFMAGLALVAALKLLGGETESVRGNLVVGNGAQLVGIGLCLFIASSQFDGGLGGVGVTACGHGAGAGLRVTALMLLLALGLCPPIARGTMELIRYFLPGFAFAEHPTIRALHDKRLPTSLVVAFWLGATVLAPIAEELFFRGLLQTFLVYRLGDRRIHGRHVGRWIAIALSSVAFGAVHMAQPHAVGALVVLAMGLGIAYERSGSLIPPIAIHALFNLKTLVWDALGGTTGG